MSRGSGKSTGNNVPDYSTFRSTSESSPLVSPRQAQDVRARRTSKSRPKERELDVLIDDGIDPAAVDLDAPPTKEEVKRRRRFWGRTYLSKYTATPRQIDAYDHHRADTRRGQLIAFLEYDIHSPWLHESSRAALTSLMYQVYNVILIVLSTVSFLYATEPQHFQHPPYWCFVVDVVTFSSFFLDYVVRLCCAFNMRMFIINMFNVFDFLSFAPMPISWIVSASNSQYVVFLDVFRLFRVFRLIRYIQHVPTLKITLKAVRLSYEGFVLMLGGLALNLVFFSTVMYFVEGSYCYYDNTTRVWRYLKDESESQFQSIIQTFWWNIVSVTTTGYGDVTPKTGWGKVVASAALVTGVIFIAFPIAIFGTNFSAMYAKAKKKELEALEGKDDSSDEASHHHAHAPLPELADLLADVKKLQQQMAKLLPHEREGSAAARARVSSASELEQFGAHQTEQHEFTPFSSFAASESHSHDSGEQLNPTPTKRKKKGKRNKRAGHAEEHMLIEEQAAVPLSPSSSARDLARSQPLTVTYDYEDLTGSTRSTPTTTPTGGANNPLLSRSPTYNSNTTAANVGSSSPRKRDGSQSY